MIKNPEMLEILAEKSPETAQFLRRWDEHAGRVFEFKEIKDQADFTEVVREIARFIAISSKSASVQVELDSRGPSILKINILNH